eukprot:scaffold141921_cov136-Phaeocystis_antarctica.AAC.2
MTRAIPSSLTETRHRPSRVKARALGGSSAASQRARTVPSAPSRNTTSPSSVAAARRQLRALTKLGASTTQHRLSPTLTW